MADRVFIVDDHDVTRKGYLYLINQEVALDVCGEASDYSSAIEGIEREQPDVVVADISLPGTSGLELIKHVAARRPETAILVVSMHDESLYAERALRAGARGYVMKNQAHDVIVQAIRQVARGGLYLSEQINTRMLLQYTQHRFEDERSPVERLTDRELEAFEFIGRGKPTSEVAEAMHISPKTVGTYRRRIIRKLNLSSGAELVQHAVKYVEREAVGGER